MIDCNNDPQVPHSYKQNVCHYKDQARYFYSAMVSALDHSVDQVFRFLCVEDPCLKILF